MVMGFLSMSAAGVATVSSLPMRSIPGSYGLPLVGPLRDRLDYFWFQGPETFFRQRMAAHKSTVFRTNMPPTFPFFVGVDPRVVAVLDCASFAALFDLSLVDKKDVLVGHYTPSVRFTGDTRVVVYQDPTDPKHSAIKGFCFDILRRSSRVWVSEFLRNTDIMFSAIEKDLILSAGESGGGGASFLLPLQKCIFAFLSKSIVGADPVGWPEVGDCGFIMLDKWLSLQLLPTVKVGVIPQPLEELLLHSFPFPFFPVSGDYKKLYRFIEEGGREAIQLAKAEYGLGEEEAIHNILFVLGFNAFGGFSVFLPSLITTLGRDKTGLQERLRREVRGVVGRGGGGGEGGRLLGFEAVREMELVRSTVYEVLRLKPPVPLQFGRARKDFTLSSHDASYRVERGELLCGYQPLVMMDPAVFEDPDAFVPDRFAGDDGRKLLEYLFWSNGPETGTPTTANKQCAAKDYVVDTACLLLAAILTRYDDFRCDDASLAITKLQRAEKAEADPVGSE